MSTTLRYCLYGASEAGHNIHPQKFVKDNLRLTVLAYEFCGMADCAFIEVQEENLELPKFITVSQHKVI